jgi:flagellar biosynthesis protein FlhF
VGLITLDTYRIGGHEQLRTYAHAGRGGPSGHDKAALQDLLGLLQSKKMVLIDTTGVAPRDPRKDEIMDVLAIEGVQQLLAVNAAAGRCAGRCHAGLQGARLATCHPVQGR